MAKSRMRLNQLVPTVFLISPQGAQVLKHPGAFALRVITAFRANQGLLLAGAVAYYTLLSIVPLLILIVIAEYERIGNVDGNGKAVAMHTEALKEERA